MERASRGFVDYRSLKEALASLQWDERLFPNSLRATIHQKKSDIVGLRVYPEYKKKSRALPYHGVALVKAGASSAAYMTVVPEIELQKHSVADRYVLPNGVTDFYLERSGQ